MQPTSALGQATEDKGKVNLQHSRLLSTSLVSLCFPCKHTPIPSRWLGIAHQLPTHVFSWQELLRQMLDLSSAAGSVPGLLVVVFRNISQESTGNHSNWKDCQKQQTSFTSFFCLSHLTHGPPPHGANRPYRWLVALSTTGGVAKWMSKSFQQPMEMVWFFRKENQLAHCLESNSKLNFLAFQKYSVLLNAACFCYGTRVKCQNIWHRYIWNSCNSCNDLLFRIH